MNEIRFHGMGGQGSVWGAATLAEAAFSEGKYAQKIPVYTGAQRGGDVVVFLRLDDKPIRRNCGIYEPDGIVVLDSVLARSPKVWSGLKEGGVAVLNDKRSPDEVNLDVKLSKLATVNATDIFFEFFGQRALPITNMTMLGAVCKATGWVKLESLFDHIMKLIPGRIGELNVEACKRGYETAKVMEG